MRDSLSHVSFVQAGKLLLAAMGYMLDNKCTLVCCFKSCWLFTQASNRLHLTGKRWSMLQKPLQVGNFPAGISPTLSNSTNTKREQQLIVAGVRVVLPQGMMQKRLYLRSIDTRTWA